MSFKDENLSSNVSNMKTEQESAKIAAYNDFFITQNNGFQLSA